MVNSFLILFFFCFFNSGSGKPQYLKLGISSETDEDGDHVVLKKDEKKVEKEDVKKDMKEALKKIPDKKAALVEVKVKDKATNETKVQTFLHLPKSFQYTITNCFCGGNCQEIHDPDVWKCNDTCRRICGTPCTVCGTRQI